MKLDMTGIGLFFGISECHLPSLGVYRVCCRLCGVRGNEREPKLGESGTLKEVRKEARYHTAWHLEKAVEEHRERLTSDVDWRVDWVNAANENRSE